MCRAEDAVWATQGAQHCQAVRGVAGVLVTPPQGCWHSVGRWGIELHRVPSPLAELPTGALGFVPPSAGDVGSPMLRKPQEPRAAPAPCWERGATGEGPHGEHRWARVEDAPSADPDSPVTVPRDAAAGTQRLCGSPSWVIPRGRTRRQLPKARGGSEAEPFWHPGGCRAAKRKVGDKFWWALCRVSGAGGGTDPGWQGLAPPNVLAPLVAQTQGNEELLPGSRGDKRGWGSCPLMWHSPGGLSAIHCPLGSPKEPGHCVRVHLRGKGVLRIFPCTHFPVQPSSAGGLSWDGGERTVCVGGSFLGSLMEGNSPALFVRMHTGVYKHRWGKMRGGDGEDGGGPRGKAIWGAPGSTQGSQRPPWPWGWGVGGACRAAAAHGTSLGAEQQKQGLQHRGSECVSFQGQYLFRSGVLLSTAGPSLPPALLPRLGDASLGGTGAAGAAASLPSLPPRGPQPPLSCPTPVLGLSTSQGGTNPAPHGGSAARGSPGPRSGGAAAAPFLPAGMGAASGRDHVGGGDVFLARAVGGLGPGVGLDADAVATQAQVASVGTHGGHRLHP